MRTELITEYYESVVTCREVLEDLEFSFFGGYHHVLFEFMSWPIKAIKVKKYILHCCVFLLR